MKPKAEYVYLICTKDNKCKIGSTSKNPYKRLQVIQRYCPLHLEMRYIIKHPRSEELEGFLHSHLWKQKGKHIHGEWFNLTEQDLNQIAAKWPGVGDRECVRLLQIAYPEEGGKLFSEPPTTSLTCAVVERHNQKILEGYANLFQK